MVEIERLKLQMGRRDWLLAGVMINLALCPPVWAQSPTSTQATSSGDVESIVVTAGADKGTATGLIVEAAVPKSASTVSEDFIRDQPAASNPFQLLDLLPGVNATGRDPTGLGRGQISVRGYQSNQIGLSIEGVPVNDSGTFNTFPQEYIDTENLKGIFITQGAGDVDTPNIGETGGAIGMLIRPPAKDFHVEVQQALGDNNFRSSYIRLDTGTFGGNNQAFISYSNKATDVWSGIDTDQRQHVDAMFQHQLGESSRLTLEAFYNTEEMGQQEALTKAQVAQYGYTFNYAPTFSPIAPGSPTVTENDNNSAALAPNTLLQRSNFGGMQINPFENLILTSKANLQISETIHVDLQPYFWYGDGNAGVPAYVSESNVALLGVVQDLNHDGNKTDTLLYDEMATQYQMRPGGIARLKWDLPHQEIVFGFHYEDANLREWQPLIPVNPVTGDPVSLWGGKQYETIYRPDGTLARAEDRRTLTVTERPFFQDTIHLLDDALTVNLGLQEPFVDRKGFNFLPLAQRTSNGQVAPIQTELEQHKLMPSAGAVYMLNPDNQVFASIAQTFRASDNGPLYLPGTSLGATHPESAVDAEAGYRYTGTPIIFSASLFNINYMNREESIYDAAVGNTVEKPVGNVIIQGAELELGTKPIDGFSLYGSGTLMDSHVRNDIMVGVSGGSANITLPTKGKELTDTPHLMLSGQLRYDADDYFGIFQAKYTGKRFSTLTNDQSVGGYATEDVIVGYRLPEEWSHPLKSSVTLSVTNILDRRYYGGINFTNNSVTTNGVPGSSPTYYLGVPRFFSAKVTAEF